MSVDQIDVRVARTRLDASQRFTVAIDEWSTIGDVLEQIQSEQDPTLRFRANCRSAQCGTCVVRANGELRRTCDTRVLEVVGGSGELVLGPGGGHAVCDLVTDMDASVWALVDRLADSHDDALTVKESVERGWRLALDEPC